MNFYRFSGSVTYGVDANSFKSPDAIFRKLGRDFFGTFTLPFRLALFFTICYPKFANLMNLAGVQPNIEKFFKDFVPEALENRIKSKEQRADFLQLLIEMKKSGIDLTENEIIGQVIYQIFLKLFLRKFNLILFYVQFFP